MEKWKLVILKIMKMIAYAFIDVFLHKAIIKEGFKGF